MGRRAPVGHRRYPAVAVRPNATPRYAPPKRSFRPEPRSPPSRRAGSPPAAWRTGRPRQRGRRCPRSLSTSAASVPPWWIHRGVHHDTSTVAGTAIAPLSPRLADHPGRYRGAIGPAVAGGHPAAERERRDDHLKASNVPLMLAAGNSPCRRRSAVTTQVPRSFQEVLLPHLPYAEGDELTASDDLAALGLDSMGVL